MREIPPPVFSRRSFIFFIVLAPACLLAVAGIVLTLQYRQFQTLVAATSIIEPATAEPDDDERIESLLAEIQSFADGLGPDSLSLTPGDLNMLAAASPVLSKEEIRVRFRGTDSLLIVESSRRMEALNGRLAWIFKRIAPLQNGWLNARMEGLPELKAKQLAFAPERGFLNENKVPRAAMTKRAGMSPKDFLEPSAEPQYRAFIAAVDSVYWDGRAVVLIRKNESH
jgi:hypothetical protein